MREKWVAAWTDRVFVADSRTTNRVESFFSRVKAALAKPTSLTHVLEQLTESHINFETRASSSSGPAAQPTNPAQLVYHDLLRNYCPMVEHKVRSAIHVHSIICAPDLASLIRCGTPTYFIIPSSLFCSQFFANLLEAHQRVSVSALKATAAQILERIPNLPEDALIRAMESRGLFAFTATFLVDADTGRKIKGLDLLIFCSLFSFTLTLVPVINSFSSFFHSCGYITFMWLHSCGTVF